MNSTACAVCSHSQWYHFGNSRTQETLCQAPIGCNCSGFVHSVDESATEIVDMVNQPPHYKCGNYEVIDILAEFFPQNPLLWQVGKYIMRAGRKNDAVEDLKKAEFYLKREITRLEAI